MTKKSAFKQVTVLEAIWTDCPIDVKRDIGKLWGDYDYGNDHYYFPYESEDFDEDWEDQYPALLKYLRDNNIKECLIHYWW